MKINKIIRSVYERVSPGEEVASVENSLLKNRFLVVMDYYDQFRGIITTDDIAQASYQLIEDCLSPKPRLKITDSVESVLADMRKTGSFVLPVFDDSKFVGVIIKNDIVEFLIEHRDKLAKTIVEKNDELLRINTLLYNQSEKNETVQEDTKRTEDMLSVITDNISDMIVLADTNGTLQYYSPSHKIILGYDLEEEIGKSVFDFVHPEDMNSVEFIFKNAVATSTPVRAEYRVRHADGHYIWCETIGNFATDENGRIEGVILTSRDITGRKQIEKALWESRERLSQIVNGTSIPVFVIDEKHTVTHWNRACENSTGIPADEVIGTTKQWSAFYTEKRPVMADLIVDEAPEEEISRYYGDKCQKSVLVKGAYEAEDFFPDMGGEGGRWFFFTAAPLRDHDGKITGAIETLQDFTGSRNAENELKASRYHVALINKILRHDVTNDLSVIRSALRLYDESREERFLKDAYDRVNKSVELIGRMKELEIFISQHRDLKLYNIRKTIKEVMKSYPSIQFTIKGRGEVLADKTFSSVIDNIIFNASLHGKADRLEIKIEKARDIYEIRIADNGTGIPDHIKEQIFEEDFAYGEAASTGLGLFIVKETIENYGGSVHVENNEPKGAAFVLKLKRVK